MTHAETLAELVALRYAYADLLCELAAPVPTANDVAVPVWRSVGALKVWHNMAPRRRPLSGPLFLAACWEAASRERHRDGDYRGAAQAMAMAVELVSNNADAIQRAAA